MHKSLTLGWLPNGTGDVYPFNGIYEKSLRITNSAQVKQCDAIVVWGGEDIAPQFYSQRPHPQNQQQRGASDRDIHEFNSMKIAADNKIPIIGVCRGAQALCAFAGGKLVQHVTGHHGNHLVTTSDGQEMQTSSCHHQMMYPWGVRNELLAWSSYARSNTYEGETKDDQLSVPLEPEAVYFPDVRGLAIQGHPEWMSDSSPYVKWINGKIKELFL
jgi:anthranilate/para-aminobenzoate synthase component II